MPDRSRFRIVEDIRFRSHRSPAGHPVRDHRLLAVAHAIKSFEGSFSRIEPRAAEPEEILRVHDRAHLREIERAVQQAPAHLDPDTYVSSESFDVARLAAGSCVDLARSIACGEATAGLAAVRPPGHHAEADRAMGFCLFNNVAIAARALQSEAGLDKLLILDWDVHHGNGTQHSFEADPSILYVSAHEFPHYPGTGDFGEAGCGAGLGTTVNIALPAGCGDGEYLGVLAHVLVPIARQFEPEMILVSCGFDAHRDDPLSAMQLSGPGYLAITRLVRQLADELCEGRVVFVLEGGYSPSGLQEGTEALLRGMLETLPAEATSRPEAPAGSTLRAVLDRVIEVHGRRYPGIAAL